MRRWNISPIHTATFAYLSNFYTCVYLLRCAILVVWTQLLICKSCTREQICTWSGLGANLLLLICCSKYFASVCKCGRMNAQQIYLYMYFTNLTALISILSIFMVGHDFCKNIISKYTWHPGYRTEARGLSGPYSRIGTLVCSDSEYSDRLPIWL